MKDKKTMVQPYKTNNLFLYLQDNLEYMRELPKDAVKRIKQQIAQKTIF